MPNILVAPDSFKGSLSAQEVAEVIAAGLQQGWPEISADCVPLADGGEGTAKIWVDARGGTWQEVKCHDPLGREITGRIGWVNGGRTAIIEAAQAAGLDLLTVKERNPWLASSYGMGEMIEEALRSPQLETLWLTLGGSATVDGGVGCLRALGVEALDSTGTPISQGGRGLSDIASVCWDHLPERLQPKTSHPVTLKLACDVTNPLLGDHGAARIFGPQKGADGQMVEALETGMAQWCRCSGQDSLMATKGAGAAGGLGFALACLGAEFHSGIDCVMEAVGLGERLTQADLIITGEGCSDAQSAGGKVVSGVLRLAAMNNVPVILLSGAVKINEIDDLMAMGAIACWDSVPAPMKVAVAIDQGEKHLRWIAQQLGSTLRLGWQLGRKV